MGGTLGDYYIVEASDFDVLTFVELRAEMHADPARSMRATPPTGSAATPRACGAFGLQRQKRSPRPHGSKDHRATRQREILEAWLGSVGWVLRSGCPRLGKVASKIDDGHCLILEPG